MGLTIKILLSIVVLGVLGAGVTYFMKVDQVVRVESQPSKPQVQVPTRPSAEEFQKRLGSQKDLAPLDWGAKDGGKGSVSKN